MPSCSVAATTPWYFSPIYLVSGTRWHGRKADGGPQQIRCPLLCLNDPSDDEKLRQQAAAAVKAAPNPASRRRVFTPEDGTLLYRQLDNFSLKHQVMFDWLDEVLDQR
jgi:hypothetical protein